MSICWWARRLTVSIGEPARGFARQFSSCLATRRQGCDSQVRSTNNLTTSNPTTPSSACRRIGGQSPGAPTSGRPPRAARLGMAHGTRRTFTAAAVGHLHRLPADGRPEDGDRARPLRPHRRRRRDHRGAGGALRSGAAWPTRAARSSRHGRLPHPRRRALRIVGHRRRLPASRLARLPRLGDHASWPRRRSSTGFARLTEAVRRGGTAMPEAGTLAPEHPLWVEFARAMAPLAGMTRPAARQPARRRARPGAQRARHRRRPRHVRHHPGPPDARA